MRLLRTIMQKMSAKQCRLIDDRQKALLEAQRLPREIETEINQERILFKQRLQEIRSRLQQFPRPIALVSNTNEYAKLSARFGGAVTVKLLSFLSDRELGDLDTEIVLVTDSVDLNSERDGHRRLGEIIMSGLRENGSIYGIYATGWGPR